MTRARSRGDLREDQAAVLVLLLEDEGLELLAEIDDLVGVDVVADRELARRDDALGLVADVEQHLVAVDLDDLAGHDVAVVELDDRGVNRIGEGLRPEVVENDGSAVGRGLGCCYRAFGAGRLRSCASRLTLTRLGPGSVVGRSRGLLLGQHCSLKTVIAPPACLRTSGD